MQKDTGCICKKNQHMLTVLINAFLLFVATPGTVPSFNPSMRSIQQVPLPEGYERAPVAANSFADYLRHLPLRKDKTIYLYNHTPKENQSLHYAVIDISTGDKDLQQCADAIMRLRAEYFYAKEMYDSILFPKDAHSVYQFSRICRYGDANSRQLFLHFMETVFINCGTYTLEKMMRPVKDIHSIQIGDAFVKAGAPGHAEIVVDMAIQKQTGKKIYLLAEGYMPAQDMHILLNPLNTAMGPWYEPGDQKEVVTASWIFDVSQLKRW